MSSKPNAPRNRRSQMISRGIFLAITLAVFGIAGLTICTAIGRGFRSSQIVQDGGAASLSPTERLYLQAFLTARVDDLYLPAGDQQTDTRFVINPGEGAGQIADNLIAAGLLRDRDLFLNYARYYGLDAQLEAGTFIIPAQTTVADLAQSLTEALPQEAIVTFIEGWRLEEMGRYLENRQAAEIRADEFLAIVQRRQPIDLSSYEFLATLPADATLEGYLFPDTYRLPLDATAVDLVDKMLSTFGERVTPAMRQRYGVQGLSLRQAVTLASIVQREAVHNFEKPTIAGVFYNRLAVDMLLQADPTVQYAAGYQPETDSWWKSPLWVADLQSNSPYNTYVHVGLPPGPIASPGLAALDAVANPESVDYIFFVVDCTADLPNTHVFSVTYEEHLGYVERCQ